LGTPALNCWRLSLRDPFFQAYLIWLRQHREDVAVLEPRVPDVEHVHGGEIPNLSAIAAGACDCRVTTVGIGEPVRTGGQHKRSDEALHIPLPGSRQCLVEIVDIEDQSALRRREPAKVEQMAVAAYLDMNAADRRAGEISRHDACGSTVEGERRRQHATISQRH